MRILSNQKTISTAHRHASETEGISGARYSTSDPERKASDIEFTKANIDRGAGDTNTYHYFLLHTERVSSDEQRSSPPCDFVLVDAEIYPPLPDPRENELVLAGLIKVLEDVGIQAPALTSVQTTL